MTAGTARRAALIAVAAVAAGALIGHLALWAFLAAWAPGNGKARLIQALEQAWPVTVTIESLRYGPVRGFRLTQVRVVDRDSQELWGAIPAMRAQVDWVSLLLARQVRFRGRAVLDSPAKTTLAFSGRYRLRDGSLILSAQTAELPLGSLSGPLTRHLPPALRDGTVRGQLHLRRPAKSPPTITGRLIGTGLVFAAGQSRIRGDLTLNGTASPPTTPDGPWSLTGLATLRRAALDGVPVAGTITHVEGSARLLGDRIEVETLTGTFLGSPWTLEGDVGWQPLRLEALASSRVELARAAEALPALSPAWEPMGAADLRIACRGAFSPSLLLDCLAQADVRGATLAGAKLAEPLTDLTGRVTYDLLAREAASTQLTGRLGGEPFTMAGALRVADPPVLALRVSGTLPLELVRSWLPDPDAVSGLGGVVRIDVEARGPAASPRLLGELELKGLRVRMAKPALQMEGLTGTIHLARDRIEIPEAALRLNGQPLALNATLTPKPGGGMSLQDLPGVEASVTFPQGRLKLQGRLTPEEVVLTEARLTTAATRLSLAGTLARMAGRQSALDLSGVVEPSELGTLPFISLPAVSSWKLAGETQVEAQFRGNLADWASSEMRGRFRARALRVRGVPLDQVVGTLEQGQRVMRLRVVSGLLAEGRLAGELTVDDRPATRGYLLQAGVTGVQLAALAQSIPAWKSRELTGQASTHLLLSGQWKDRASWLGEGWLTASGERLGDVPLLEKVSEGLFGVLAERLGLESLRRAQITEASVQWRLARERFSTDNLRLGGRAGIEPITVYARGSVDFDQTLDFIIEPEVSEVALLQAPTTSTLASTVLKAAGQLDRLRRLIGRHRLTGTLQHPVYRFEFSTQEILRQLAPGPSTLFQNLFDATR